MPPDKLARQITPGQPQSGDEQNFLEVVESLTSSEHTPEQTRDTGGGGQSPGNPSARSGQGRLQESENALENLTEESMEATPELLPESSTLKSSQSSDISDPDEPPIGAHIDLIAWNLKARPGRPTGGEAMGLRAALSYLRGAM